MTAAALAALLACHSAPPPPAQPSAQGPAASQRQAGLARRLPGDFNRLPRDLGRAASAMGFAVLDLRASPDALVARVLQPNDRILHLDARPIDPTTIAVTARSGRFGDRAAEAAFLDQLAATLASPAARAYGGRFELPPWPTDHAPPP